MTTIPAASRPFEFDGVVRLTKMGVIFLLFTMVIGFAAINTGNNALYIVLSFMLAGLLLSGVASKGGLKHLRVELQGIDEAWAGKPADGRLRIANRSPLWNVRDVTIISYELATPVFIPLLDRRSEIEVSASFLFHRRGTVDLKGLDLYTRYPFGFFRKKRRVRIDGQVIVFPRLLDEETARERFRAIEGELHSSNRPGPGTEIHSFREFVRGDSMRHVYWKKSASLGRWIIKQTEVEAARAVHVVIDPYKPPHVSDDDFERMVSEAATFIYEILQEPVDLIVSLPRRTLTARQQEGARPIFRALALIEPSHEPVAQTIERDALVFAVRPEER